MEKAGHLLLEYMRLTVTYQLLLINAPDPSSCNYFRFLK